MGRSGVRENEEPVHPVWVSSFQIAVTPVTHEQFRLYLSATEADPPPFFDDPDFAHPEQPVVAVSFDEALAYCRWLSRESGREIRLPTEAEREKASRGGVDGAVFPW
jgi:formylglycine-generating enzyme required for sulfatase activity